MPFDSLAWQVSLLSSSSSSFAALYFFGSMPSKLNGQTKMCCAPRHINSFSFDAFDFTQLVLSVPFFLSFCLPLSLGRGCVHERRRWQCYWNRNAYDSSFPVRLSFILNFVCAWCVAPQWLNERNSNASIAWRGWIFVGIVISSWRDRTLVKILSNQFVSCVDTIERIRRNSHSEVVILQYRIFPIHSHLRNTCNAPIAKHTTTSTWKMYCSER